MVSFGLLMTHFLKTVKRLYGPLALILIWMLGMFCPVILAEAVVTPGEIEVNLQPSECISEPISVTTGKAPIPKLDVVLMIDVTGSMEGVIDEVTRGAEKIAQDVRALVPDAAFALVTFADYPGDSAGLLAAFTEYGASDDYAWRLDQNFTQNDTPIRQSLEAIRLMHGGDDPESYLRALYESQFLDWREGSRRVILLFGDTFAHDPDPGRDEKEGTRDDLTQDSVVKQLASENITVLSIYSSFPDFYTAVAQGTGGQAFHLQNAAQVSQVIQELIEQTVTNIQVLTLDVPTAAKDWLTWSPAVYRDVAPEVQREFSLDICVPDHASSGKHTFDVDLTGDGASLGHVPVIIHVVGGKSPASLAASWCPLPSLSVGEKAINTCLLLIPILVLLLLGLTMWLLSRRRSAPTGYSGRPATRAGTPTSSRARTTSTSRPTGATIQHGKASVKKPPKR